MALYIFYFYKTILADKKLRYGFEEYFYSPSLEYFIVQVQNNFGSMYRKLMIEKIVTLD